MARFASTLNRMVRGNDAATLKASGAETTSTTGTAADLGEAGTRIVTVDVTAASGTTPTLIVVIECSADGTNYAECGRIGSDGARHGDVGTSPANITGVSTKRVTMPIAGGLVRSRSIIGGTTPSFTYSVALA